MVKFDIKRIMIHSLCLASSAQHEINSYYFSIWVCSFSSIVEIYHHLSILVLIIICSFIMNKAAMHIHVLLLVGISTGFCWIYT